MSTNSNEDTDIIDLLDQGITKSARILVIDPHIETVRRYQRLFGADRVSGISRSLTAHLWDSPDVRDLARDTERFISLILASLLSGFRGTLNRGSPANDD